MPIFAFYRVIYPYLVLNNEVDAKIERDELTGEHKKWLYYVINYFSIIYLTDPRIPI